MRTSSLLGIGLQDPLEDVVAAQTPDRIVVDGVHTGAEGLLLQLCHPANHQPASHTQQQQQQQLQHSPGPGVFPGRRLTGPRARLRFWRDSHSRQSSVSLRRPTLSPRCWYSPLTLLSSSENSPGPGDETILRIFERFKTWLCGDCNINAFSLDLKGGHWKLELILDISRGPHSPQGLKFSSVTTMIQALRDPEWGLSGGIKRG